MIDVKANLITEGDFHQIIEPFKKVMTIWKVGLYYGSMLYFEMGEKCNDYSNAGGKQVGQFSLTLECNDWVLEKDDHELCGSTTINREFAENAVREEMIGSRLDNIAINVSIGMTFLNFDNDYRIRLIHEDSTYSNHNLLFSLYLPSETIILTQGASPQLVLTPNSNTKIN